MFAILIVLVVMPVYTFISMGSSDFQQEVYLGRCATRGQQQQRMLATLAPLTKYQLFVGTSKLRPRDGNPQGIVR